MEVSELDSESRETLRLRSGVEVGSNSTICLHHIQVYIQKYVSMQKTCTDPKHMHKKRVSKGLKALTLQDSIRLNSIHHLSLKPGQKLCVNCIRNLTETEATLDETTEEQEPLKEPMDYSGPYDEDTLNNTITQLGVSPFKCSRVSDKDKPGYGKRKIKEVREVLESKVASALSVDKSELDENPTLEDDDCSGCSDLDRLVQLVKEKIEISSQRKKVQLLTLAPESWSIAKCAAEFNVSEYQVKKARSLKKEKGILAEPQPNTGKPISKELEERVKRYYEDDEHTRLLPGAKDFKSVRDSDGKRMHRQKRLILMNLNELFEKYKEKYPEDQIGFSKFCELRPPHCITVGSRGTHSVCVCTIHQNVKLLVSALPTNGTVKYHDLISKMVCSVDSKLCMVHRCPNCPRVDNVREYIMTQCEVDDQANEIIHYKQWVTTDRTTLEDCSKPLDAFIDVLTEKLEKLTAHHYIAKSQAAYLSNLKETLNEDEAILILDFAENYSFVVQDAVQSFHWENSQATLHPFVAYFKADGKVQHVSMCVVSDCLQHDTIAVNTFQKHALEKLKEIQPGLKKVYYFSDGAASQYKNFKNFANLVFHETDFGLLAEWHFFATSHGKNACDGVGGTVKREAAKASLQATTHGHILTPADLYRWSEANIKNVTFFYVSKDEVHAHATHQKSRFAGAKTVQGTRDYHCFIPTADGKLLAKRISKEESGLKVNVFRRTTRPSASVGRFQDHEVGQYVACSYDDKWWVGYIKDKSDEESDFFIKFMHPHWPARHYHWPTREDTCWVPPQCIKGILHMPMTSNGRQYSLDQKDNDLFSAL